MASVAFEKKINSLEGFKEEARRIIGEYTILESRLGYVPPGKFDLFSDHNPALTQARQYVDGLEAIKHVLSWKHGAVGIEAARGYVPVIKRMKSKIDEAMTAPYSAPVETPVTLKKGTKTIPLA